MSERSALSSRRQNSSQSRRLNSRETSLRGRKASAKGSASRRASGAAGRAQVVVLDSQGNDVTPRSLLDAPGDGESRAALIDPSASVADLPLASISGAGGTSFSEGAGGSSGLIGASALRDVRDDSVSVPVASAASLGEARENGASGESSTPAVMAPDSSTQPDEPAAGAEAAAEDKPEPGPHPGSALTEEELDAPALIELRESETFWLLDEVGTAVSADAADAAEVKEAAARKEALKATKRDLADMFVESAAQTFSNDRKTKDVQVTAPATFEAEAQASGWDIFDAEAEREPDSSEGLLEGLPPAADRMRAADEEGRSHASNSVLASGAAAASFAEGASCSASGAWSRTDESFSSSVANGTAGGAADGAAAGASEGQGDRPAAETPLSALRGLPEALLVAERAVMQNCFHQGHLAYRNVMQPADAPAGLRRLWGFDCKESEGRNVACVEWNPAARDVLAVAYGEFDFSSQRGGLILFWSLKNPAHPETAISTPRGVTSLAFSAEQPNVLAVGLYDGSVCIYDVRKPDAPLLEAGHAGGKHTDPVWGLRWVAEGKGLGEALVSISTDGRVTQWNVQKGLEHTDLMVLRRVAQQGEAVRGTISRRAAGLCLDFHAADNLLYVAGTEDGHVHKCSRSYNEQVLAHYFGHSGPVYRVRWSPFGAGAFLSCSADWTIKLWDAEKAAALFTFQPSAEPVSDVAWSPSSATIFASATGDGRLDIWDLAQSTISPIHTDQLDGTRLSCVSFAPSSPVLVAGGDNGVVGVYALTGYLAEPSDCTAAQQLAALEKVTGADAGR